MPLPLGQGAGQAMVKQQSLCSCQLLPKTLDRDLPFPGPLRTLTSAALLWLPLWKDFRSLP